MSKISPEIFKLLLVLFVPVCHAQYTDDCGTLYGCLRVPQNCQNSNCQYVAKWQSSETFNKFILISLVNSSPYDSWTALAFSKDTFMGDDSVVMCRLSTSTKEGKIETYYNQNSKVSDVLQTANPSMGLFDLKIEVRDNKYMMCYFSRQKTFFNVNGFFNLTAPNKYNILVATGQTNYLGTPVFHGANGYYASPYKQDFQSLVPAGPDPTSGPIDQTGGPGLTATTKSPYHERTSDKKKAHSCLMIFAWIFLASTAIIMPRHYKYLFRPQKVCGAHMWFVLHFPVMVFAAALNLIALLLILAEKDWKWIQPANTVEFVHSIFGIVSIGLLYLQMFLGAARPACCASSHKESKRPRFWKLFHSLFGNSAIILSVVTMFLGVVMPGMNLSRLGWGIMIGWACWVIIFPLLIEILLLTRLGSKGRDVAYKMSGTLREHYERIDRYRRIFNGIKSFYLFCHILIALGIALALVIIIGLSDDYYW